MAFFHRCAARHFQNFEKRFGKFNSQSVLTDGFLILLPFNSFFCWISEIIFYILKDSERSKNLPPLPKVHYIVLNFAQNTANIWWKITHVCSGIGMLFQKRRAGKLRKCLASCTARCRSTRKRTSKRLYTNCSLEKHPLTQSAHCARVNS